MNLSLIYNMFLITFKSCSCWWKTIGIFSFLFDKEAFNCSYCGIFNELNLIFTYWLDRSTQDTFIYVLKKFMTRRASLKQLLTQSKYLVSQPVEAKQTLWDQLVLEVTFSVLWYSSILEISFVEWSK